MFLDSNMAEYNWEPLGFHWHIPENSGTLLKVCQNFPNFLLFFSISVSKINNQQKKVGYMVVLVAGLCLK